VHDKRKVGSATPNMDVTFLHSYECEQLDEIPDSSLPRHFYPGATTEGGGDGILVKVRPEHGQAWLGMFAFGRASPKGLSGLYTTPDPERFCVIAGGDGYFVTADQPERWDGVEVNPITDVRPVSARGIIVFADYTQLCAYGAVGLVWKTNRLAWDGLKITEITSTSIIGEFWDAASEAKASFVVNLASGTHEGGAKDL
jgi:hypothetical protein